MHTSTTWTRWLLVAFVMFGMASTAHAQRSVTLTLNMATVPDTLGAADLIEVRGAADPAGGTAYEAPYTFTNGGAVISWGEGDGDSSSTIEPTHMGGDYWGLTFQVDNEANTQFKFYSTATADAGLNGWEADPNPTIAPGADDVVMPVHFFEVQGSYRDHPEQDKGEYDWRPYEQKDGMVAVWYRIYANTVEGVNTGYARDGSDALEVRGDDGLGAIGPDGTPLDWSSNTGVKLQRELADDKMTGYDIWSGVAYYPESAIGSVQNYKYVIGAEGWEADAPTDTNNRQFTVPAQDTTLHWDYFSYSPAAPTEAPVTANVIFAVDVTPLEDIGVFDKARGDTLQIRGTFNGWGCDDLDKCLLQRVPGTNEFEALVPLTLFPETAMQYKYRIQFNIPEVQSAFGVDVIPSGWEEPYSTQGGNREELFAGDPNSDQIIEQVFNDIFPETINPDAGSFTDVHFAVDMTPAMGAAEPFDPSVDQVAISFRDPIWMLTQEMPLEPRDATSDGNDAVEGDALDLTAFFNSFHLTDDDGDMVYEGTLRVIAPTYMAFQYYYAYGDPVAGTWSQEPGGALEGGGGARRQRYIARNTDGSWPDDWVVYNDLAGGDMGPESFTPEGSLPGDPNWATRVAVEELGGELPTKVTLSQNYPNPFNPSTSLEYTLDRATEVNIQVYDMLGRSVATLVDAPVQAGTYRVSFDASEFASGTYLYRMQTPNHTLTRMMILIK